MIYNKEGIFQKNESRKESRKLMEIFNKFKKWKSVYVAMGSSINDLFYENIERGGDKESFFAFLKEKYIYEKYIDKGIVEDRSHEFKIPLKAEGQIKCLYQFMKENTNTYFNIPVNTFILILKEGILEYFKVYFQYLGQTKYNNIYMFELTAKIIRKYNDRELEFPLCTIIKKIPVEEDGLKLEDTCFYE